MTPGRLTRLLAKRIGPFVVALALIIALQQTLTRCGVEYYLTQITMSACYALVVIGLCLLMGYAGQVSLGHAGFFAIGGYTSAYLTKTAGICSPLPALGIAGALASVVALLIGIPVLRLKGHYLAMATLGFGLIVYRFVLATSLIPTPADGISDVPPLLLWGELQFKMGKSFRVESYYIAWSFVLVALLLAANLVHSRVGRALRAIHENEEAAHSLGVNTYRYKLVIFIISAAMAAVGGSLATHFKGSIGPSEATAMYSVRYVAIVAVGGMANLWGALLMATVLNFLSLRGIFGRHDDLVFGGILIVMMLFAPDGLAAAGRSLWRAILARRHARSATARAGEEKPEVQHVG